MAPGNSVDDLLLAALLLARYAQSSPAGEAARQALYLLIDRSLAPTAPTGETNLAERLEDLSARGKATGEEKEKILSLHRELLPFFAAESRYVPGFIQKRIAAFVGSVNGLYRAAGGRDLEGELAKLSPDDWSRLEKAAGPAVAQVRLARDTMSIRAQDFRDLALLRSKIQVWAPALLPSLREKGFVFTLDSISRVNQSSGYIWVAFLPDPSRRKMEQPTFSLSFTPRHCRAGLELGGKTRPARESYYRKLLAGELDDIVAEMAPLGGVFLDVAWYFSIRDSLPMSDYLEDRNGARQSVAGKVADGLRRLPADVLYTWNLLLPVVLIPPEEFAREGIDGFLVRLAGPVVKLIGRIAG